MDIYAPSLYWGEGERVKGPFTEQLRAAAQFRCSQSLEDLDSFCMGYAGSSWRLTSSLGQTSVYCQLSGGANTSLLPDTFVPLALPVWQIP